jgi:acetyl esterase/lipase
MENIQLLRDLEYARVGDRALLLDLYLPGGGDNPGAGPSRQTGHGPRPVIIWIHGGAWRTGSKDNPRAARQAQRGYAVASISYRLSQEATFPAQIHDCKAAVRWLRAHAGQYNLDAVRFAAWGASAGGHLAVLLGTSGGVADLEGNLGHQAFSSRVQAVCDFFGPSDFLRMSDVPGVMPHDTPDSPESQLVGGPIQDNPQAVNRANPITYVTANDPPFLIVHGVEDYTVIANQSELLHAALQSANVESTLHLVPGAGHGFQGATDEQLAQIDRWVDAFFDRHLRPTATDA